MAENECIPFKDPGSDISFKAEAAVIGKRFVSVSDPAEAGAFGKGLASTASPANVVMSHAVAGTRADGVAKYDVAAGGRGGAKCSPATILPVTAGAIITAGDQVEVGANGQAIPLATGIAVGKAMDTAALGADCPVKLY